MTPNKSVKSGTKAFNIPVRELESAVCALVKRKAGIPFPKMPTMAKYFQYFFSIDLKCFMTKGMMQKNEMLNLRAATSVCE